MIHENNDNKSDKKNYIYFIASFPEDLGKFKIYICLNDGNTKDFIKLVYEKKIPNKINIQANVYRLEIMKDIFFPNELEVTVVMEEEANKAQHKYIIKIFSLDESFFEYNFKLETLDVLPLKKKEQFNIFLEALNGLKESEKDKEREKVDFILSTKKQLSNELKDDYAQIDGEFYFSLFLESPYGKNNELINDIILLFDHKKIKSIEKILKDTVDRLKNKLQKLEKEFGEAKNDDKILKAFYYLLLCFNIYFDREGALNMFENKNILNYLLVNLGKFRKLTRNLILKNEIISALIQMASSYEQILNILFFSKKDLEGLVLVLTTNYNAIKAKKSKEENKKNIILDKINLWDYIEPNIKDEEMLSFCKERDNLNDIVNYNEFFEAYLNKYKELGFEFEFETLLKMKENLEALYIRVCQEFYPSFHSKILNLIEERKLKNIQLLNVIEKDKFFNNKDGLESNRNAFDIFKGIDIDLLEKDKSLKEDFFKKWKKISTIYSKVFKEKFVNKILSLIRKKEDFHLLNDFFAEIPQIYYLQAMRTKYLDLIDNKPEDSVYLIKESNLNDSLVFIKSIEEKLDYDKVINIYMQLLKGEDKTRKEAFLESLQKYLKDLNLKQLLHVLAKSPDILKTNFERNLSFTKEELLSPKETDDFKFLKGLADLINNKTISDPNHNFLNEIRKNVSSIGDKIKNLEINYDDIKAFFSKDTELKNIFKNKVDSIYKFLYNKGSDECLEKIENIANEIKEIIKKLELIYEYYCLFFKESRKKEIENYSTIIDNLKKIHLGEFKSDDYEKYLKDYEVEIKKEQEGKKITNKDEIAFLKNLNKKYIDFGEDFFSGDFIELENISQECVKDKNSKEIKEELKFLKDFLKFDISKKHLLEIKNISMNLMLIAEREFLFNSVLAITKFVDILEIKYDKSSYEKLKKVKGILKNNRDIKNIKDCKETLKTIGIIKEDNKDNYNLKTLIALKDKPDSIKYLYKINEDDCSLLREIIKQSDEKYVLEKDIDDLLKCIKIASKFGSLNEFPNKNFTQIIKSLNEIKITENDYFLFENYINKYDEIINLQSSVFQSEFLIKNIQKFLNSEITLTNDINNFVCKLDQKDSLNKDDIMILKERVLISKAKHEEFEYFTKGAIEIFNISNKLEELFKKGYPEKIEIKIKMNLRFNKDNNEIIFYKQLTYNHVKSNYKKSIDKLNGILLDFQNQLLEAYKNKPYIRYLYGRQFKCIYDCYKNIGNVNVDSLFNYITDNNYKKAIKIFKAEENKDKDKVIENLINSCESYLKTLFQSNGISLEAIYPKLDKNKSKRGVFSFNFKKKNSKKCIYAMYNYFTGRNPIAQNILLFNEEMTNDEFSAFLYRAFLCQYKTCFIIEGIDNYNEEKINLFFDLLKELYHKDKISINSLIIILYYNTKFFYERIYMKKDIKELDYYEIEEKNYYKYKCKEIEILYSDSPGVGKSTYINEYINEKKKKGIYFPIGGKMETKRIVQRLKEANINNECLLHLQLKNTNEVDLMNEFLFSLLILRYFGRNDEIFYLPKDVEVKIELPNDSINFFYKFEALSLFSKVKLVKLSIDNINSMKPQKDLEDDLHIVYKHLYALENLASLKNDKDLKSIDILFKDNKKEKNENEFKFILDKIKTKIKNPNYYEIISFIKILSSQLQNFNKSSLILNENKKKMKSESDDPFWIRKIIVEFFFNFSIYLSEGAFSGLYSEINSIKNSYYDKVKYDEDEHKYLILDTFSKHNIKKISLNIIGDYLFVFHKDLNHMSIISNLEEKEGEELYEKIQTLRRIVNPKEIEKDTYRNYKQKDFLEELKGILGVDNPVSKVKGYKLSLEEICEDYVFTADNFFKMILIFIKLKAKVPVIMMGETGCGKTSLIRKLSELLNNGKSDKMKILNIHPGTNDDDIIDFINKIIESNKNNKEEIWIFLNEINSCDSLSLISELICNHTYYGKYIPQNIIFIGACNPYRKREEGKAIGQNEGLKYRLKYFPRKQFNILNENQQDAIISICQKRYNLVYAVNPLPQSLLSYVFDFGNLDENDEKDYIRNIIKKSIEKIYYKNFKNENEVEILYDLAGDMILESQNFMREFNDKSVVSLREIRRFNVLFEFFNEYFEKKYNNIEDYSDDDDFKFYNNLETFQKLVYNVILTIFSCYYLRITDKTRRKQFSEKMDEILKKKFGLNYFEKYTLTELFTLEEKFIVDNIKLDKGIAKNETLLDNIFSLFISINTKIPIFIVGNPGCSKSLSVKLLIQAMQGRNSENNFFRKFPKLLVFTYKCNITSTSKDVENIYKKARTTYKSLKNKKIIKKKNESIINEKNEEKEINNDLIPMIYFDEIGLLEYSPYNTLKAIHSKLDYDSNEGDNKFAFVGLSNWILDPTKKNSGITISIPNIDIEDCKLTSLKIANSYSNLLPIKYKSIFEKLGENYYYYRKVLHSERCSLNYYIDFHGNRDFYYSVKNMAKTLLNLMDKEDNESNLVKLLNENIERNYTGIIDENFNSLSEARSIFNKNFTSIQVGKKYDISNRIENNIEDNECRNLLVFGNLSTNNYILSSILEKGKKKYTYLIGSYFPNDLLSEDYALKILKKIEIIMEDECILVLSNLDSVLTTLYDLFNQNYIVIGKRNYARLSIGSNSSLLAYVNKGFKCIIIRDKIEITEEEPTFINRFENHIISMEYLLIPELIEKSKYIESITKRMIALDKKKFTYINYNLEHLLINCSLEQIQAIIFKLEKDGINRDKMLNEVLSIIALTLPQDIIINMRLNGFMAEYSECFNIIMNSYRSLPHSNFVSFIKGTKKLNNIIYTFSDINENIENIGKNIDNSTLGISFEKKNIKEIIFNSIKSENELEIKLEDLYNNDNYKICIIKLKPYESEFMNYLKYLIENKQNQYKNKNGKIIIFIVHMKRILDIDLKNIRKLNDHKRKEIEDNILGKTLFDSSGFCQVFIDNLNGNDNKKIENIIKGNTDEIFNYFVDYSVDLKFNLFKSISYMKFNVVQFEDKDGKIINNDNYIEFLILNIFNNNNIINLILGCIKRQIFEKTEDVIHTLFSQENCIKLYDIDIIYVIEKMLIQKLKKYIKILLYTAEKDNFFASYINLNKNKNFEKEKEIGEKYAQIYFENLMLNDKIEIIERPRINELDITEIFFLPGIKSLLTEIRSYVKINISEKFIENENVLRHYYKDKTEEEILNTYFNTLNLLNNKLAEFLKKKKNISFLFKRTHKKVKVKVIYDLILNDYIALFIYNIWKNIEKPKEVQKDLYLRISEYIKAILDLRYNIISQKLKEYSGYKGFKDTNIIKKLALNIVWLESYEEDLISIISMILLLPISIDEIKEAGKIVDEISERNPEYMLIVNKIFFIFLNLIFNRYINMKYSLPDKEEEFLKSISHFKYILSFAKQIDNKHNIKSKKIYTLEQILLLLDTFYLKDKVNNKNIQTIIDYFIKENIYIENTLEKKIIDGFNEFYKFLSEELGRPKKCKNFYKILNFIFVKEINKYPFQNLRTYILNQILSDDEFLLNSYDFVRIILLEGIVVEEAYFGDNIKNIEKRKDPSLIKINDTRNPILEEIIVNTFENAIFEYFDRIKKYREKEREWDEKVEKSFKILRQAISILDTKNESKDNLYICKLYSIVYIRIFLYEMISIFYRETEMRDFRGRKKFNLNWIGNILDKNLQKVIRIYIYKIFYLNMNKNINEFRGYEFNDFSDDPDFREIFDLFNLNECELLLYNFIPLNNLIQNEQNNEFNIYENLLKYFEMHESLNFKLDVLDEFNSVFELFGIDHFIIISMNKIISKLCVDKYLKESTCLEDFFKFSKKVRGILGQKDSFLKLYDLLYMNRDNEKKPNLLLIHKIMFDHIYEILLHGFRFCISSVDINDYKLINGRKDFEEIKNEIIKIISGYENEKDEDKIKSCLENVNEQVKKYEKIKKQQNIFKKNLEQNVYLFKSFFTKEGFESIKESFIPGIDSKEDYHLTTLEDIEMHFENYGDEYGCYVCSCGFYHYLPPNGFPNPDTVFNCPYCGLQLGWDQKKKSMIIREGYYRIFITEKSKNSQMGKWKKGPQTINWILKDDYIKNTIGEIKSQTGFIQLSKNYFKNKNRKVRKLSFIGYRLLNLISYLFLFFGHYSGFISEDDFKNSLINDMDIFEIIEYDWNLLKEFLLKKNIWSIQIFFNMIFEDLSKIMNEYGIMKKEKGREEFEEKVEDIIKKCFDNFDKASKFYIEKNSKLYDKSKSINKEILVELYPITNDKFPEEEYPLLKYFSMIDYNEKKIDIIKTKIPLNNKHLLLNQLLMGKAYKDEMKILEPLNNFQNYFIENYSYKISRDDEHTLNHYFYTDLLLEKLFKKNDDLFQSFKSGLQIDNPENWMNLTTLNKSFTEKMYSKLIHFQNEFLDKIINSYSRIINSNNISKDISALIPIQKASPNETLLIEKRINDLHYNSLNYIVNSFSKRDIFIEEDDGKVKINYYNYNSFIYDLDELEKNLSNLFLLGVKKFESQKYLTTFKFASENIRWADVDLFEKFNSKYPIEEITSKEKEKICDSLIKYNIKDYRYYELLEILMLLIFHFSFIEKNNKNVKIKKTVIYKNLHPNIKIPNESILLLKSIDINITKIPYLYLFIEHLFFSYLIKLLNENYKKYLNNNEQKEYFIKNDKKKNNILAKVLRKYITRYLFENNLNADILGERPLSEEILKKDLWSDGDCKLNESLSAEIQKLNLNASQAYKLYQLIGEEDKKSIEEYEKYINEGKKEEKKIEGNEKYINEGKKEEKKTEEYENYINEVKKDEKKIEKRNIKKEIKHTENRLKNNKDNNNIYSEIESDSRKSSTEIKEKIKEGNDFYNDNYYGKICLSF